MSKLCKFPDCGKPRFAKKLCRLHYSRMMRGKPLAGPKRQSRLTREQIEAIRSSSESLRSLAKKFGISYEFARQLRNGREVPTA